MSNTPYDTLPDEQFWSRAVTGKTPPAVNYDPAPKLRFDLRTEKFATAGSCFAQHFARELVARGGQLLFTEQRHPLVEEEAGHGYGLFSARYGNLYSTLQLRDLLEQACGDRPPVFDFAQREDGRWVDLLRPRAVPEGFSSAEECRADRRYHLGQVQKLVRDCTTWVFTLGLTETWMHAQQGHAYALCPGVAGGRFDASVHQFRNLDFHACHDQLDAAIRLLLRENPGIKVLLTVSPVMLVATMEARGVLQSSIASKSILRAVADACAREHAQVDYFPSYEIITGPQARGQFFDVSGRDVTAAGVKLVMDSFFATRVHGVPAHAAASDAPIPHWSEAIQDVSAALDAECDEILLDRRGSADGTAPR